MANALFTPGREGFLDGSMAWNATTVIKVALLRSYTRVATHRFLSDVTGAGGILVATATLASKTATNGVADAADTTFTAAPAQTGGAASTLIVCYMASAVTGGVDLAPTAQRLVGLVDTATNLPIVTNGGDVNVAWDPAGIFVL